MEHKEHTNLRDYFGDVYVVKKGNEYLEGFNLQTHYYNFKWTKEKDKALKLMKDQAVDIVNLIITLTTDRETMTQTQVKFFETRNTM